MQRQKRLLDATNSYSQIVDLYDVPFLLLKRALRTGGDTAEIFLQGGDPAFKFITQPGFPSIRSLHHRFTICRNQHRVPEKSVRRK